jgi:hypothetical protein
LLENSSLAAGITRAVGRGKAMKKSKFTEAQIAFILRQGDEGAAVGEICRKVGVSEATYYNWRKKYASLMPSEMKRLRQLKGSPPGLIQPDILAKLVNLRPSAN